MDDNEIKKLFETEDNHLKKLHHIVAESVKEEQLIVSNLLNPA